MRQNTAMISGLGAYLPKRVVTNDEIAKNIDLSSEWIFNLTGIKQRQVADENEATSDLAVNAAKTALYNANLTADQIDLIIVSTLTPDLMMPSTAAIVQGKLGANNAAAFDIGAACSGFVYGLAIAYQFINTGSMKHILVIGAEKTSQYVDWKDRTTCILFGDGAGAVVVSVSNHTSQYDFQLGADGGGHPERLMLVGSGTARQLFAAKFAPLDFITMNGKEIFKFGTHILTTSVVTLLKRSNYGPDEIDTIFSHQANKRIIEYTAEKLRIPLDKFYINIEKRANTSSATIPIAMYDASQEGKLERGDRILLVGFGAGLTWGGMIIEY